MLSFLEQVAHNLIEKFGNDLSRITVVFPNRRARLFFNEYLVQLSDHPIWAPQYASIDELFKEHSVLKLADPLYLQTELYNAYQYVYQQKHNSISSETFDEFYFFGEILLSDFNDIDKNLVDNTALFSNLAELDKLKDNFEHLDQEQWKTVERFFNDISENRTDLKDAFYSIWSMLGDVYHEFKKKLEEQKVGYDGMISRSVIEQIQEEKSAFNQEKYLFVGFNVLTECERQLFKELKRNNQALFYWDYDTYYMKAEHEAGRFMQDNLMRFGDELKEIQRDNFLSSKKTITLIESPSETAQAGYIQEFLNKIKYKDTDKVPDTSIVLCNEQNLQAVMHSTPERTNENEKVSANITMGFPLTQTPVFSFIYSLAELQLKGVVERKKQYRFKYVLPVLRHPYIRIIFPEAIEVQESVIKNNIFFPNQKELINKDIFQITKTSLDISSYLIALTQKLATKFKEQALENDGFYQLYSEAIFRTFQSLNRLHDLIEAGKLVIEPRTYLSLLKRMLSTTSVPFHGEPARGLQIMGLLETRNMDFKNLLIMSTNEGVIPKSDNDSSFIPHFIRTFFKMTTIEHQNCLYAYYFYRLLQRAENIALIYNTAATNTGKMEKSRYLLQLLTESGLPIKRIQLKSEMQAHKNSDLLVHKSPALIEKIKQQYDLNSNSEAGRLSPTAINNFIDCGLRFYLQYIMKFRAPKELSDEMDNSILGSVFHKAMEIIYAQIGRVDLEKKIPAFTVQSDMIEKYLEFPHLIDKAIVEAFKKELFGGREVSKDSFNGEQLVYFDVAKQFIKRVLKLDKIKAPFKIVGLEKKVFYILQVDNVKLQVGGIIDRLDEKNNRLDVIDYKTGGNPKECKQISDLFKVGNKRPNYILQAFIYSTIQAKQQSLAISPALFYVHKATDTDYSPTIEFNKKQLTNFIEIQADFDEALSEKLSELFNPDIPFEQTKEKNNCKWCDFKDLCGRQ